MPQRLLSEAEFEQIKAQVLAAAPPNLSEADFARYIPSAMGRAIGEAEASPPPLEGSAVGRFASNAGAAINPVTMATGLYQAVRHPIETVGNIYQAGAAEAGKAAEAYQQGRYSEMVGHGAAAALPLIGPAAAAAGEQIGSGDIAGGLGAGVGLVGSILAPTLVAKGTAAVRPALAAVGKVPAGAALAEALDAGAQSRLVDVMAPKVGRQKVRFGGMAEKVAPALLDEPGLAAAWSREGVHAKIGAALEDSKAALDAAHDARLSARTFNTEPLIDALLEKRRALTAETVEASKLPGGPSLPTTRTTMGVPEGPGRSATPPTTAPISTKGAPLGRDVVPGPYAPRVATIDRAIAELRALGPRVRYESLRRIRAAYDLPAEVTYNPSTTADFLTNAGGARGAADVTGSVRTFLSGHEPATAEANARFSLMQKADDVLEATREVERVRPTVGRKIMASFLTSLGGTAVAGLPGAIGGLVLGPVVDAAMGAGVTTKLQTAQLMTQLAKAIRSQNPQAVASVAVRLRARLPTLGPLLDQLAQQAPDQSP